VHVGARFLLLFSWHSQGFAPFILPHLCFNVRFTFRGRGCFENMVDVGTLIDAMEKFGVTEDVLVPVAEAVEARPTLSLDDIVAMLRGKGVSILVAHRVKNALLSGGAQSSTASVSAR
jgi:hypothetical protein